MKTTFKYILLSVFAASGLCASAYTAPVVELFSSNDTTVTGISVTDISMTHNGNLMTVGMSFDLTDMKMHGDRAVLLAPVIVNGADSIELNPIGFYGRTRWIQYRRNGSKPLGGPNETAYQYSHRPDSIVYLESVPFTDWMDDATLVLRRTDYGCCRRLLDAENVPLAHWSQEQYIPSFRYVQPKAAMEKRRELEGRAYVEFPVNQTIIYPEYRRNTAELDSIRRTIDVVRNDPDATIDTVWLKGFASPESPYAHNADLARGRTEALKRYINGLYNFNGVQILTDHEPEDWEGLRAAVEGSTLPHRSEILSIIDSDRDPDPKEWVIKSTYPDEYKFMLQNFYPALRHTDYRVSYTVRSYTDPAEILNVMRTRPANLDLNEFYLAASALEPGSSEYNDVFETAVRLYPDDPTANLNAANAAMQSGEFERAARYLEKAGDSPEAEYARSIFNTLTAKDKTLKK